MYRLPTSPAQPASALNRFSTRITGLYHRVGVETAIHTASPHRLVSMLYDGLLESLALARGALQVGQIDVKCKSLNRAISILEEGLRCALNTQAGGELAENLNSLYCYVALRLTHANLRNDQEAIEECIRLIEPVRQAWLSIGDHEQTTALPTMEKVVA